MRRLPLRLILSLCIFTLSIALGRAQEQVQTSLHSQEPTGLQKRFGFSIDPTPWAHYEHPISPRALLTTSVGVNFSFLWTNQSSDWIWSDPNHEETNASYFSGIIPVLHAGLRYYPFRLSSTSWVPNRGIYAELGGYAILYPLKLFPSGDYRRHTPNYVSIMPHLLLGFRAQVFDVITLDAAIGPMKTYTLGAGAEKPTVWKLSPRISIGLTL